jgi:hypothetical protein
MQSFDFVTFQHQLDVMSIDDIQKVQRLVSLARIKNGKDAFTLLKEWKDKNQGQGQLAVCSKMVGKNKCSMNMVVKIQRVLINVTGECKLTKKSQTNSKIRTREKASLKKSLAKDVLNQLALSETQV